VQVRTFGRYVIVSLYLCSLISSCGGGGSAESGPAADSMAVSIEGGPVTSYVETPSTTAPPDIGRDPYVWSSFDAANNKVTLFTYAGYNGPVNSTTLEIDIAGTTAGAYPVTTTGAVFYTAPDGNNYFASPFFSGSSGTIVVTRYDANAGGKIQGTFDVISVVRILLHERTARLTGTFDVTRD
jgi:hypothetical protein